MTFPKPEVGLVVSFAYLWNHEEKKGQTEGVKNRPCVIITAVEEVENRVVVTVSPIMHSPPESANLGVEMPPPLSNTIRPCGLRSILYGIRYSRIANSADKLAFGK